MNITFSFNDKYYRYVYVAMYSILKNNAENVSFYLLHTDVKQEHQKEMEQICQNNNASIEWIYIDRQRFPALCQTNVQWTIEAYYRLLLGEVLPHSVERILYLDADIIVNKSLKELYDMDFEGNDLIACADASSAPFGDVRDEIFREFEDKSYICSGVILFNMEQIRKRYTFDDYMGVAQKFNFNFRAPDQDIINYLHHGKIKVISNRTYNMFGKYYYSKGLDYTDALTDAVIVHFTGWKPWDGEGIHYNTEKLWWDYAKETHYYNVFLEEFMEHAIEIPMVYDTMQKQYEEKTDLYAALQKSQQLCEKLYAMVSGK